MISLVADRLENLDLDFLSDPAVTAIVEEFVARVEFIHDTRSSGGGRKGKGKDADESQSLVEELMMNPLIKNVEPKLSSSTSANSITSHRINPELSSASSVGRKLAVITVATENLLSAYNSASVGDVINLLWGTVFGPTTSVEFYGPNAIHIVKPVTIKCENTNPDDRCELNGRGDKRVMYINSGTSSTTSLIGLMITNGYVS